MAVRLSKSSNASALYTTIFYLKTAMKRENQKNYKYLVFCMALNVNPVWRGRTEWSRNLRELKGTHLEMLEAAEKGIERSPIILKKIVLQLNSLYFQFHKLLWFL